MLGVGGDVGYRGCEPRIEGIVQSTKKVLYNIKQKWFYVSQVLTFIYSKKLLIYKMVAYKTQILTYKNMHSITLC